MTRYCLIGPTHPFRGGIAHYTTLLTQHLAESSDTLLISFTSQYPSWLFPGRDDRDPSSHPLKTHAEYLLNPIWPFSWRKTIKRIQDWGADVVIIPWWVPFWAPSWSAIGRGVKKLPNKPRLIFICHNVLPHEHSLIDRYALRAALAPADGCIVHAEADAIKLASEFPDKKIAVAALPTFAGLGRTSSPIPEELKNKEALLLFFGFIRPYKGLDVLIDAMAMVKDPIDLHLVVAGEFWEDESKYRTQIRAHGLESAVTIRNQYLPDEELAAYVDAADVVVLPYRAATQSAVVQVAFGRGLPVITTDVGGLAEVVKDGQTGLVVPPGNPEVLAAALSRYFDEDLGPLFRANIQATADQFSWAGLISKLASLVENGST